MIPVLSTFSMMSMSLGILMQSQVMTYVILLPIASLVLFFLLCVPAFLRSAAKPMDIARAAFHCMAQSVGIVFMIAGSLPALQVVISNQTLGSTAYMGLLTVFAVGGLLFLWNDVQLKAMSVASKEIPETLYFYTWKFIGLIIVLSSGISLALNLLFSPQQFMEGAWMMDVILFFYGMMISFFTLHRPHIAPAAPARIVPTAAKKKASKK